MSSMCRGFPNNIEKIEISSQIILLSEFFIQYEFDHLNPWKKTIFQYSNEPINHESVQNFVKLQNTKAVAKLYESVSLFLSSGINSEVVGTRTKSIRSLTELVLSNDVSLESIQLIVSSIIQRVSDTSPTVRDTAIDCLGRIYLSKPSKDSNHIYSNISSRILDVGTAVRKRVLKFLRDVYFRVYKESEFDDIASNSLYLIFSRLEDSEDTVRVISY